MSSSLFQVEFALGNLPGNQNNLLLVYKGFVGCLVQCLGERTEISRHWSREGRRCSAGRRESRLRAHPSGVGPRKGAVRHGFHSHTPQVSLRAAPCQPKPVLQPLQHITVTTGMLFAILSSQKSANLSPNRNGVSPTHCKKPILSQGQIQNRSFHLWL